MRPALLLLAHGSRDPGWADPVRAIRGRILTHEPSRIVELAFLEFMDPRPDAAIDSLVARGMDTILVAPLFLGQGGHLKRDITAQIAAALTRHPGTTIGLLPSLGESEAVRDAIAAWLMAADHTLPDAP